MQVMCHPIKSITRDLGFIRLLDTMHTRLRNQNRLTICRPCYLPLPMPAAGHVSHGLAWCISLCTYPWCSG